MTPRPVQGAGSFGLHISPYPSLFVADEDGTLLTRVSRSFGTRTRGGGTVADSSFPASLNPVQEVVARPPRPLAVQVPRWRSQVALGRYMYRRSRLAALRAWRVGFAHMMRASPQAMGVSMSPLLFVEALADAASRRAYPGDVPRLEAASDASGDGMGGVWFDPEEVRPMEAGGDEDSGLSSSLRSFRGVEEWVDEGL